MGGRGEAFFSQAASYLSVKLAEALGATGVVLGE
jgi:hypothetical protein